MKFVNVRAANGSLSPGIVTERGIVLISDVASTLGIPAPVSTVEVLTAEAASPGTLAHWQEIAATLEPLSSDPELGPAIANPPKLFCLAGNYQSHLTEGGGQGRNHPPLLHQAEHRHHRDGRSHPDPGGI